MLRVLSFIGASLLIAALHWLLWRIVGQKAELPKRVGHLIKLLLCVGAAAFPTLALATVITPRNSLGLGFFLPFFWFVPFSYLFALGLGLDLLLRAGRRRSAQRTEPDPARRRFLARAVGSTAALGTGAITAGGVSSARNGLALEEVTVRLANWPEALQGFRIALLSDLHVSGILGRDYVQSVVSLTLSARPDLIAITGDLIDAELDELRDAVAPLADLQARHGTFFVTGNHEYYSGDVDAWLRHLSSLGMRVLHNERLPIGTEPALFDLAGVPDWSRRGKSDAPSLARALSGRNPARPVILLAHQPKQIHEAAKLGVDLQLSGHTHAGQVWPFGTLLAHLGNPYVQGLHHHHKTQIYVSRGTGYWAIPMRVGCPPEITVLSIQSSGA